MPSGARPRGVAIAAGPGATQAPANFQLCGRTPTEFLTQGMPTTTIEALSPACRRAARCGKVDLTLLERSVIRVAQSGLDSGLQRPIDPSTRDGIKGRVDQTLSALRSEGICLMGRKYRKPPVVEAICEFRFQPGKPWDLSFYGRISEQLRTRFPTSKSEKVLEFTVESHEDLGPVNKVVQRENIRLFNKAGTAYVLVAPDRLAVTHVVPYPTWEKYLSPIQDAFKAYQKIARPKGFQRIGLRYRNKIDFPTSNIEIHDFFTFYPTTVEGVPEEYIDFMVRKVHPYSNGRDLLRIEVSALAPPTKEQLSVSIDLDYFLAQADAISLRGWKGWLNTAHDRLERGFESCITPALRKKFQEVT